ncbi:MAG: HlyD family efflux transporter periplasmic adaptor subunit [Planctomycetota bacterium]|nr:HlyD family efflux transporter periplasmic adaptor subunit [Planctomycetota bacterium]
MSPRPVPNSRPDPAQPTGSTRSLARLFWHWSALLLYAAGALIGYLVISAPARDESVTKGPRLTYTVPRRDLRMTITEVGTVESAENTELICQVPGRNTVTWVVESGAIVKKGDVLVRLDTLYMEEQINERSKYANWSRAGAESSKFNVRRLKLAVPEYRDGRFIVELKKKEEALAIAQMDLRTAENELAYALEMAARGYESQQEVDKTAFQVTQARMQTDSLKREISDFSTFTQKQELASLQGKLDVAEAEFAANDERAFADESRRDRALEELKNCIVRAPRDGLVIYPSAAKWKTRPDISVGGAVHKDQVLLLMPDLKQMQVKIGIHESQIDRVQPGLKARVTLGGHTIAAEITSVASVAQPGGSWTGNVVKYDTIIKLPADAGLKPGMSAEVELIVSEHEDVLTVPVAAVMETGKGAFCWVHRAQGPEQRSLTLGASDDALIIVESGLNADDKVFLDPTAFVGNDESDTHLAPTDASPDQTTSPPDQTKTTS